MGSTGSKIAFVIPWYGEAIGGGAEAATRATAKALAQAGESVEILTTCVRDFRSDWSVNYHEEGATLEGGLPVHRFASQPRNTHLFDLVNGKLMNGRPVTEEEETVFLAEMVNSPGLCRYIEANQDEYIFIFIPYMFGTTYWGSSVAPHRSLLVPCLHDESYAHMKAMRGMFQAVRGVLFLSHEEFVLAKRIYALDDAKCRIVGSPVDCGWNADAERFAQKFGLRDFLLYAGRSDKGKNAELLVQHFHRLVQETRYPGKLVLMGGAKPVIPGGFEDRVVNLGFLDSQDKYDCYAASLAICVPSTMESFSLVLMESWLAGRPAIVNQNCPVTVDFCRRSNGGLFFANYEDFREIMIALIAEPDLARTLGAQGRDFVLSNFEPREVAHRYLSALHSWGFS